MRDSTEVMREINGLLDTLKFSDADEDVIQHVENAKEAFLGSVDADAEDTLKTIVETAQNTNITVKQRLQRIADEAYEMVETMEDVKRD